MTEPVSVPARQRAPLATPSAWTQPPPLSSPHEAAGSGPGSDVSVSSDPPLSAPLRPGAGLRWVETILSAPLRPPFMLTLLRLSSAPPRGHHSAPPASVSPVRLPLSHPPRSAQHPALLSLPGGPHSNSLFPLRSEAHYSLFLFPPPCWLLALRTAPEGGPRPSYLLSCTPAPSPCPAGSVPAGHVSASPLRGAEGTVPGSGCLWEPAVD